MRVKIKKNDTLQGHTLLKVQYQKTPLVKKCFKPVREDRYQTTLF